MLLFMYSHFHVNSLSHVCKILVIVSGKIKINYKKMLYTQIASTRHGVFLEQRSFRCEIGENCSNSFILYKGKI